MESEWGSPLEPAPSAEDGPSTQEWAIPFEPAQEVEAEEDEEELAPAAPVPAGGQVSLNTATYEELRGLGLSVTQTGRLLAHRERGGGFGSVDELDQIPGFPRSFLTELKSRVTV